jgi:thiol-disulfide isomerase/thioredoxin
MKRYLLAASLSAFLVSGCGEPSDDGTAHGDPQGTVEMDEAMSIVILANDALKSVDAVSYTFRFYGQGFLETELNAASGTADLSNSSTPGEYFIRVGIDSSWAAEGIPVPSTYALDGSRVYSLNERDSIFSSALISDGGEDLLSFNSRMLMQEFVIDEPFSDEIHADPLVLEGTDTVSGTECDVLFVGYSGGVSSARWFLGTEDHLPRMVERHFEYNGQPGSMILEVDNIEIVDSFEDNHFVLTPPDGFELEYYSAFLPTGSPAPDWELLDSEGNTVSLSSYDGSVVVMDFWATWCGPCREVMPMLQALSLENQNAPLEVVGINVWENADPVAFMAENGYTYTLLLAGDEVAEDYLVNGIPTFYVIDRDGNIAFAAKGASSENEEALASIVESLLTE